MTKIQDNINHEPILGVDIGGTKVRASKIQDMKVTRSAQFLIPKNGSERDVLHAVYNAIDEVLDGTISGMGIGVPSVVDIAMGIVYDVQNIPSWKEVHLGGLLSDRYDVPVHLNNDANCFALGERYFGKGKGHANMIGLIIGTGMAAGIVINNKIYNGPNCGAGEFGMIPYLDHYYEYYCSGQFFKNVHGENGPDVYQSCLHGQAKALAMFAEFGNHLGHAINTILYAIDPEIIILGGSVCKGYEFFREAMWAVIHRNVYRTMSANIKIDVSDNADIHVLGAAALCLDL